MNEITKITILHTENGITLEPVASIYVDQDPFVCFARMFTEYYVYSYCGHDLFNLYLTRMPYFVEIKEIGTVDNLANFTLPRYPNIDLALKDNANTLFECVIANDLAINEDKGEKRKSDYLQFLAIAKDEIEAVQAAIDYSDILSIDTDEFLDELKLRKATKKFIKQFTQHGFNEYTVPLLSYALELISDNL